MALRLYSIASQNGNIETVKLLLDNGANVNEATVNGATPLYMALCKGYPKLQSYCSLQLV